MPSKEIATIKDQVKTLPPDQKVELIQFLTESLSADIRSSKPLQFAKYANTVRKLSSPEDFQLPEWHPTESELNGH